MYLHWLSMVEMETTYYYSTARSTSKHMEDVLILETFIIALSPYVI